MPPPHCFLPFPTSSHSQCCSAQLSSAPCPGCSVGSPLPLSHSTCSTSTPTSILHSPGDSLGTPSKGPRPQSGRREQKHSGLAEAASSPQHLPLSWKSFHRNCLPAQNLRAPGSQHRGPLSCSTLRAGLMWQKGTTYPFYLAGQPRGQTT